MSDMDRDRGAADAGRRTRRSVILARRLAFRARLAVRGRYREGVPVTAVNAVFRSDLPAGPRDRAAAASAARRTRRWCGAVPDRKSTYRRAIAGRRRAAPRRRAGIGTLAALPGRSSRALHKTSSPER